MAKINIFSKRTKEPPRDAYTYDSLPDALKNQILLIWREIIERLPAVEYGASEVFYTDMQKVLCKEYGMLSLVRGARGPEQAVEKFFLEESDAARCMDCIEVFFGLATVHEQEGTEGRRYIEEWINEGTTELNQRFQEHGVGYEWRDGLILRIDSKFLHAEAVIPALTLLHERYLHGANEEFLRAHEHFRHKRHGECINECLKSFESTMKGICHKRKWLYAPTSTAKRLLGVCEANGLFPSFMSSSMGALLSSLEGVATVRNKLSAHGQGVEPVRITEEFASFALHTTASNILFLAALEKGLGR